MDKKKKTYKAFLEPDTENVATSLQTFLRWEKCSQGGSSVKDDNSDRLKSAGESSSKDATPPAEAVLDPTLLIEDRGSGYESNHSPIRSTDESDTSSILSETFDETSIQNEQSSNDSKGEIPTNFDDNDNVLNGEIQGPYDIFTDIVMFEAAGLTIIEVLLWFNLCH
ncbi:uncharacterized protein [Temnothorax nylanderi]|uniref:uncharacterized protein n=1 Tax=Temnothorax nylanderi TaxID=102681 RepID=UPI003A873A91